VPVALVGVIDEDVPDAVLALELPEALPFEAAFPEPFVLDEVAVAGVDPDFL
jgi:hypothetical protein